MGKKQELLDPEAIVEARAASRMALMSGQATSASVADIAVRAYLAARRSSSDEAEVVGDDDGEAEILAEQSAENMSLIDWISDKIGLPHDEELSRSNFTDWLDGLASPSGVKAEVTEAQVEAAAREIAEALETDPDAWIEYQGVARAALVRALGVRDEGMGEATVERVARALAADELGMGDPQAVVATIVEREWRSFERQARVALGAIQGDAK